MAERKSTQQETPLDDGADKEEVDDGPVATQAMTEEQQSTQQVTLSAATSSGMAGNPEQQQASGVLSAPAGLSGVEIVQSDRMADACGAGNVDVRETSSHDMATTSTAGPSHDCSDQTREDAASAVGGQAEAVGASEWNTTRDFQQYNLFGPLPPGSDSTSWLSGVHSTTEENASAGAAVGTAPSAQSSSVTWNPHAWGNCDNAEQPDSFVAPTGDHQHPIAPPGEHHNLDPHTKQEGNLDNETPEADSVHEEMDWISVEEEEPPQQNAGNMALLMALSVAFGAAVEQIANVMPVEIQIGESTEGSSTTCSDDSESRSLDDCSEIDEQTCTDIAYAKFSLKVVLRKLNGTPQADEIEKLKRHRQQLQDVIVELENDPTFLSRDIEKDLQECIDELKEKLRKSMQKWKCADTSEPEDDKLKVYEPYKKKSKKQS